MTLFPVTFCELFVKFCALVYTNMSVITHYHYISRDSAEFFKSYLRPLKTYTMQVHHESIFQNMFWAYPESLRYTYNMCLYSDYFRLVQ